MKTLSILILSLIVAGLLWRYEHAHGKQLANENQLLQEQWAVLTNAAAEMKSSIEAHQARLEGERAARTNQLGGRMSQGVSSNPEKVIEVPPPDPARGGGWATDAGFFYFPKELLSDVDYQPVKAHRVTDEAAALFGMSPIERAAVNKALEGIIGGFRTVEAGRMQAVAVPASWETISTDPGSKVESTIAYTIPDLSEEAEQLQKSFQAGLGEALGSNRGRAFQEAIDAHVHGQMDDLGKGERIVGFVSVLEKDGSKSLWYAHATGPEFAASYQRVPEDLSPDSQIAYYAGLFGVTLPSDKN